MANAVEMADGPPTSPDSIQAQAKYPNFSRPRLGHRRSYSTGLPFPYTKNNSITSSSSGYSPTRAPSHTVQTTRDNTAEQRSRVLQTKDDGMVAYPQKKRLTESHHWGEADVTDAFQRWVTSENARKKLRQPYYAKGEPETRFLSASPPNIHKQGEEKGPIYEKVDGVVMDTRPKQTGPYGMEQTIPEIEARDIRDIQVGGVLRRPASPEIEDDRGTYSSSSTATSTESNGASPDLWSASSGSSSTASTDNSSLKPYQHIPKQYVPVTNDEQDIFQQAMSSQSYSRQPMTQDATASDVSELDGHQMSLSPQSHSSQTTTQKQQLDAISEEGQDDTTSSADAAPAPVVAGVKDEDVSKDAPKVTDKLKQGLASTLGLKSHKSEAHAHDASQPRMLAADGLGSDGHVYELEAPVPAEVSSSKGSIDHGTGQARLDVPKEPSFLDKVEHGISRAAHALHDKVKKNVTFNPVNDVRFMTPSPNPSMDTIRPIPAEPRLETQS